MDKLQKLKEEIETEKGASHTRQRGSPGTASSDEYGYRQGLRFALRLMTSIVLLRKIKELEEDDKRG